MYPSFNDGDDITQKGARRTQNRARKWKMEGVGRREGVTARGAPGQFRTIQGNMTSGGEGHITAQSAATLYVEGVMYERTGSRKWKKGWRRRLRAEE